MSQPPDAPDQRAGAERTRPRERPFTDFGQWGYGHLDLRVFDDSNDTFWVDITGTPHRVVDMTPDYRINVLAFLERNATYFHLMTIRRGLLELSSDLVDGDTDPLHLQRLSALLELDPVTWITTTSVARALKKAAPSAPPPSSPRSPLSSTGRVPPRRRPGLTNEDASSEGGGAFLRVEVHVRAGVPAQPARWICWRRSGRAVV